MTSHVDEKDDHLVGRTHVPGGNPRLPFLSDPVPEKHVLPPGPDGPGVMIVDGGFRSAPRSEVPEEPAPAGFAAYSPPESLFSSTSSDHDSLSPCSESQKVLGLTTEATWHEIKAAHRAFMTELHPDRFVTASDQERDAAAERLAEVNLAFHTLAKECAMRTECPAT